MHTNDHSLPAPSNSRIFKRLFGITDFCNWCLVRALLIISAGLDGTSVTLLFKNK